MVYILTIINKITLIIQAFFIAVIGTVFPPILLFFPSIFIFQEIKEGVTIGFGMFLITCAMLIPVSYYYATMVLTLFGPLILIYHLMMSKSFEQNSIVFIAATLFFLSMIIFGFANGINPDLLQSKELMDAFVKMQESIGVTNTIPTTELTIIYNRSLQLMPAVLVIISLVLSYFTFYATLKKIIALKGLNMSYQSFMYFNIPRGLVVAGVVAIGLVSAFGDRYFGSARLVIENLLLVFSSILFFVGLSVIMFLLTKLKAGRFVKVLVTTMGFIVPGAQIVFVVAGLLDNIFNFRRLAN